MKKFRDWLRKKEEENKENQAENGNKNKKKEVQEQQPLVKEIQEQCPALEDSFSEIPDLSPVDPSLFEEEEGQTKEEILEHRIESAPKDDIIFGKIAFKNGFINQSALDEGVQVQIQESKKVQPVRPLGQILIDLKHLDKRDVKAILEIQKRNLEIADNRTGIPRKDYLFGKIALKKGFVSEEQVNECLRTQTELEKTEEPALLGELLINAGYLTQAQLNIILEHQHKREVHCEACHSPLVVYLEDLGKKIECPICEETIKLPKQLAKDQGSGEEKPKTKKRTKPVSMKEPKASVTQPTDRYRLAAIINEIIIPDKASEERKRTLEKEWYVALGGKSFGPVQFSSIVKLFKKNIFQRQDCFWHEVLGDWKPAQDIPEFRPYLPNTPEENQNLPAGEVTEFEPIEQIRKLAELKEAGIITEEEFADAKKLLLAKI